MWHEWWKQIRIILKTKGDNVIALTLLIKMRPNGPKMAIIARGLSLRLAALWFPPDAIHTPGVAHVVADVLSRIYAPEGAKVVDKSIHPCLSSAAEVKAPKRDESWYRATTTDPSSSEENGSWGESWNGQF